MTEKREIENAMPTLHVNGLDISLGGPDCVLGQTVRLSLDQYGDNAIVDMCPGNELDLEKFFEEVAKTNGESATSDPVSLGSWFNEYGGKYDSDSGAYHWSSDDGRPMNFQSAGGGTYWVTYVGADYNKDSAQLTLEQIEKILRESVVGALDGENTGESQMGQVPDRVSASGTIGSLVLRGEGKAGAREMNVLADQVLALGFVVGVSIILSMLGSLLIRTKNNRRHEPKARENDRPLRKKSSSDDARYCEYYFNDSPHGSANSTGNTEEGFGDYYDAPALISETPSVDSTTSAVGFTLSDISETVENIMHAANVAELNSMHAAEMSADGGAVVDAGDVSFVE